MKLVYVLLIYFMSINFSFGQIIDQNFDVIDLESVDVFEKWEYDFQKIWILDSFYYYNSSSENWILQYRGKIVGFDPNGNYNSIFYEFWNSLESKWTRKDTLNIEYHNSLQRKSTLRNSWNSEKEEWTDSTFYQEWDINGNLLRTLKQTWNFYENKIKLGYDIKRLYNENNLLIERVQKNYNIETYEWINKEKKVYTYNSIGGLIETIKKIWIVNDWIDFERRVNIFGDNNLIVETQIDRWNDLTNEWEHKTNLKYNFDDNGNEISTIKSIWENDVWVDNYLTNTYYNNGRKVRKISQLYDKTNNRFNDYFKYLYNYDTNGNQIKFNAYKWDVSLEKWINHTRYISEFDNDNNELVKIRSGWDINENKWINHFKYDNYWSQIEVNNTDSQNNTIYIYPNPTSGLLDLSFGNIDMPNQINLYTLNGKLIRSFSRTNRINIYDLKNGVYVLKVIVNGDLFISKIIKE